MRLHTVRQVPYEGLGFIGTWARAAGYRIEEIRAWTGAPFPKPSDLDWLVVLGGPMGVCDRQSHAWLGNEVRFLRRLIDAGTPVLGICLGAQLLAAALGADVRRHVHPEIGWHSLEPTPEGTASLLEPFFRPGVEVLQWHHDTFDLPDGAVQLCRSAGCEQQAFAWGEQVLALQFHPEVTCAEAGAILDHDGASQQGGFTQAPETILDARRFDRLEQVTTAPSATRLSTPARPRPGTTPPTSTLTTSIGWPGPVIDNSVFALLGKDSVAAMKTASFRPCSRPYTIASTAPSFDFVINYRAPWAQTFGLTGAFYNAEDFSVDTHKIWLSTGYAF